MKNGFTFENEKIEGFSAMCEKCGSHNVSIDYEFNYYGGATGYDHSLELNCRDCKNNNRLPL